jgi:hypothetical protein
LRGLFPKDDYILDLAIELSADDGDRLIDSIMLTDSFLITSTSLRRVWAVEVNPFFETTDSCLYSWHQDDAILMNTESSIPDFRIRQRPSKGASSLIYGDWQQVLREDD